MRHVLWIFAVVAGLAPGCALARYVPGFDVPLPPPLPLYETMFRGPVPLPSYVDPPAAIVPAQLVVVPIPALVVPAPVALPQVYGYRRTTTTIVEKPAPGARGVHRGRAGPVTRRPTVPALPRAAYRRTTTTTEVVPFAPSAPLPPPVVYAGPAPAAVVTEPVPQPTCRVYSYWNGERCLDARTWPPDLR